MYEMTALVCASPTSRYGLVATSPSVFHLFYFPAQVVGARSGVGDLLSLCTADYVTTVTRPYATLGFKECLTYIPVKSICIFV